VVILPVRLRHSANQPSIVIHKFMTNHVQTVVYTIYMNRFYLFGRILALLTIAFAILLPIQTRSQPAEPSVPPASETTSVATPAANDEDSQTPIIEKTSSAPIPPPRITWQAERHSSPVNNSQQMEVIANYLNEDGIAWIESEYGKFFAIWQEDRSGDAKGAVLIVNAEGEHPSWPQTTKPLHESLPDYGWATLAIQLPFARTKTIPQRTLSVKVRPTPVIQEIEAAPVEAESTVPTSESTTEKTTPNKETAIATTTNNTMPEKTINIDKEIEAKLASALKFLHERGQFNIVLMGNGVGAIRTHEFMKSITPKITDKKLKAKIEKPIRASIIFNARNKRTLDDKDYEEWFFDPEVPILDIYTDTDIRNLHDAKVRKTLGKQKKVTTHSQVKLAEMSYEKNHNENRLSRRIRSFLDAYVQGIEVANARLKENEQR
jgi:hypothetical protein